MNKVLITGGSGLIGQSLIPKLAAHFDVISLGKTSPNGPIKEHIVLDLASDWSDEVLPSDIDAVIHLAQSAYFREFPEKSENVFQVNTLSTLKLLNYAQKAQASKFMYASSGGVYGKGNESFVEDTPIISNNKLGFYLGTKLCSEVLVESYASFFDVDIMRFFFVYGEQQRETMLIPRLLNAVIAGDPITLQGEGGIKINPIYVEDASQAIVKLLSSKGSHQVNIAGAEVLSLKQIAEIIESKVHHKPSFKHVEGEPQHLIGDASKMNKLLGKPQTSFSQGIDRLLSKLSLS